MVRAGNSLVRAAAGGWPPPGDRRRQETFPSIGSGLWWGVQTVTTVGYGDNVPTNLTGRLVAVLVMLLGIGFLTVITASITSTFVSRSRHEPSDAETAIAEQLRQVDSRLERIEAALSRSSSR